MVFIQNYWNFVIDYGGGKCFSKKKQILFPENTGECQLFFCFYIFSSLKYARKCRYFLFLGWFIFPPLLPYTRKSYTIYPNLYHSPRGRKFISEPGAIFVGFSKKISRGVRLCSHEKVPKIFLAQGAIVCTRKGAKYLLFFSKCPAGQKIWGIIIPGFTYNLDWVWL